MVDKLTLPAKENAVQLKINDIIDNTTLESLKNVTITSPSAGQNLTYDATNQVWKNTSTTATVAWGGITGTLSDQTDLKNALDGKVSTTSNASRVYSTDSNGNQSTHYYSNAPYNNAIACFSGSATLKTGTPSTDNDCAPKKYVDDSIPVVFTGADGTNAGTAGLVKAPAATDNTKFLKGDGTWGTVDALPSQTSQSGKFLTTNGTTVSWAAVDALPSQTSQSGKFLTTNGTSASWADVPTEIPAQSGNSGKFLTTNGTAVSWGEAATASNTITFTNKTFDANGTGNFISNLETADFATGVIRTSVRAASSASDTALASEKAVATALGLKLDGYNLNVAGQWTGGVHLVNFITVDYTNANSENGVFIKVSMVNSHGNGITGKFFQDAILSVTYTGTVAGTIYRYFAEDIDISTSEYYGQRKYGDIFWTIDTTNKIVKFYVIMRQYSYTYMTPYFRLNVSTGGTITQHTGSGADEYSSGTQYWATINWFDTDQVYGATSPKPQSGVAVASAISGKQDTLVSGANIKTINNTSLLGSGNISITGLPSQTSQSGKFLTTNGTSASWADIPEEIPSQSGNSGKFLTTNGTSVSWATVDALPSQTSQSGKFLTTNGTTASWANIPTEIPSQTSQSGKFLTTNGTSVSWGTPSDTLNTAGSTDSSSKLFLIGATSQTTSSQTYSQDTAFVDTNGRLNSAAPATSANDTTVATTKWVKDQGYTNTAVTFRVWS